MFNCEVIQLKKLYISSVLLNNTNVNLLNVYTARSQKSLFSTYQNKFNLKQI